MRVDPMMHLNEAITSVDAIAYPLTVVLAVVLLVVGAVGLCSREIRDGRRTAGARAVSSITSREASGGLPGRKPLARAAY